ncbi:hypothetical protein D8674_026770 [Pyrus ussuriensis x Pyrus communis]|uniref:Uncharacterized protein n=1 Tax=Pyrus ussuriensis x Pyrus communis TaxID=2448454 RepID=A0A5N5I7T9_9ROSA|nr:hypothetical protein D8674_026770 [Pyrus ussuriensis x Pyrus communis]
MPPEGQQDFQENRIFIPKPRETKKRGVGENGYRITDTAVQDAALEVEQIAPKEENNKGETNKAEKSDKEMAKVGDEPKENLDVREESPKEEKRKWEEDLVEADDQLKEKSEVAEEAPKEENNKFGRFVNWEDVNIANDNGNWGEELRQADEASSFNDNGSKEIEDNLKVKTAENVRIDSEEVVAEIEAERLKAEIENLKREKKALDEKLISESLVYEDSRCVRETQNQKLSAMLHEAYLESKGLVKELENHCKLVKEMVTRFDSYEEDGRRWEQEKREMSAKLEALTAGSEKDKSVAQNCKEDLRKEWEEEKASLTQRLSAAYFACNYYSRVIKNYEQTNLKAQTPASEKDQGLSEANSLCQYYYDVALHNAETALKLEEEKNTSLRDSEEKRLRLTQRNAELAKNLQNETDSARRFCNLVYKLDEKCWMLEDEKINLTAKLCAATASSELYRSMLHDKRLLENLVFATGTS